MKKTYSTLINNSDYSNRKNLAFLFSNLDLSKSKSIISMLILIILLTLPIKIVAQNTYTVGNGTISSSTLGVCPFATINRNSRSQYLYISQELIDNNAISGNIVSFALNITNLALPLSLKPENITIKLGTTTDVTLGNELIENLPVYYSSSIENITTLGWHTFTFSAPFEWDGISNIIVEICRSNTNFGTSFEVESELNNLGDYRTIGLYSNSASVSGCTLTGVSPMTNTSRRTRPNAQFTMTQPCDGVPSPGITAVTSGSYCSGNSFTLSIQNGALESGLAYQWQTSPNGNGPWTSIEGAINTIYTTNQAIATYYRRATTCLESQQTINSLAILVDSDGCYCNAEVTNDNNNGITNVTFGSINNSTASGISYNNFTNIQTEVQRNSSYTLSARVSTLGNTNYSKAWIDWNSNGTYESNEGYSLGNINGTDVLSGETQLVQVPANAVLGPTFMRIRTKNSASNNFPEPCGAIENGETEDYSILVGESLSISSNSALSNDVLIYSLNKNEIVIKLLNEEMESIVVFDLSGRVIFSENNLKTKNNILKEHFSQNQVLIFQVKTINGKIFNKKIIL